MNLNVCFPTELVPFAENVEWFMCTVVSDIRSGTSIIRHSVGRNIVSDYRGCRIIKRFLVQSNMVTVPQDKVELERMSDYRGVRLQRFCGTQPHQWALMCPHLFLVKCVG